CVGSFILPDYTDAVHGSCPRQYHRQRHGRRADRRGHGGAVVRCFVLLLVFSELDLLLVETVVQVQAGGVIEDLQCTRGHHGAGGDHGVLGEPGGAVGGQRGERAGEQKGGQHRQGRQDDLGGTGGHTHHVHHDRLHTPLSYR